MRIRNLLIAILTVGSTVAFAQEQRQIKEEGKTVFKPHWFMQVQAGAAHTVGEADFTDLISPAAAVNVGYKFAPAFGARLGVSGWQAKAGWSLLLKPISTNICKAIWTLWQTSVLYFVVLIRNVYSMDIFLAA